MVNGLLHQHVPRHSPIWRDSNPLGQRPVKHPRRGGGGVSAFISPTIIFDEPVRSKLVRINKRITRFHHADFNPFRLKLAGIIDQFFRERLVVDRDGDLRLN